MYTTTGNGWSERNLKQNSDDNYRTRTENFWKYIKGNVLRIINQEIINSENSLCSFNCFIPAVEVLLHWKLCQHGFKNNTCKIFEGCIHGLFRSIMSTSAWTVTKISAMISNNLARI